MTLTRADDWPAGDYTFTLVLAGEATTCSATLDDLLDSTPTCDDDTTLGFDQDGALVFATLSVALTTELRIELDADVLFDDQLAPEFRTYYPNGEECGPECTAAEASVALSE